MVLLKIIMVYNLSFLIDMVYHVFLNNHGFIELSW